TKSSRFNRCRSVVEKTTKTGHDLFGSKPVGNTATAIAFSGTAVAASAAYDFSAALSGTEARTTDPAEIGMPANSKPATACKERVSNANASKSGARATRRSLRQDSRRLAG